MRQGEVGMEASLEPTSFRARARVRVDSRNTFPDGLVCVRPPASAEWLWYCVRLWSTSVDQSDSARGVSTPAIAGQASSAQAILRGQVLGTISEGCNTPRVPAHCCIPLRSLYSDISQCDFRRGLGLRLGLGLGLGHLRIPP